MKKIRPAKIIFFLIFLIVFVIIILPFASIYISYHRMPTVKNVEHKYWNILESAYGVKFPDKSKVEYSSYYHAWNGEDDLYIKLSIPNTQIQEFKNNFPKDSQEITSYSPLIPDKRVKWYSIKEEDYDYKLDIYSDFNGLNSVTFSKEKNGRINIFMRKTITNMSDKLNKIFKKDKWPYH